MAHLSSIFFEASLVLPGRTRFERLILIGETSSFLGLDALRAAVTEAKTGRDVGRFEEAITRLESLAPEEAQKMKDPSWADKAAIDNQRGLAKLEAELKGYKNNLVKESIRVCSTTHMHMARI